ncbi:hypothetical protein Pyrfu_1889 [Pyrolobus fumarii 1A]|uniref:Uncharacterized protein n=1 Tax=Pyrolobus fumarii (strain DSM 11204 / 1A) TaxID=694429 RepID=G0ED64_PYRF1|nr:hypothetical protein [Pyrolobus fumarii]AEM39742.1 hypothetical protein Pyrfu_1889 [Pyrolobus fumarii 1A]
MIKRWPKRREFLAYYTLWRAFGDREFNLGEAVEILKPYMGGRVAERLVKRLVKQGFLVRIRPLVYRAKPLTQLLDEATAIYFAGRLRRRGYEAYAENGKIIVADDAPLEACKHPLAICERSPRDANENEDKENRVKGNSV